MIIRTKSPSNHRIHAWGVIVLLAVFLFQSCANPVPPAGGDKDTTAPVLVSVENTLKSNEQKITLVFDENINTSGTLVYSPKSNNPENNVSSVKVQRNTVSVSVPLHAKCIYLDQWVVDLNEKNPYKNSSLLLSADSGEVILKLKGNLSAKSKFGVYILRDTLIYYSHYKKDNAYHFQGLPAGVYSTVVIEGDNNQKIENNEAYNVFYTANRPKDTIYVSLYPAHRNYKSAYFLNQQKQHCIAGAPVYQQWLNLSDSLSIKADTLFFTQSFSRQVMQDLAIDSFITTNKTIKNTQTLSYGIFEKDTMVSTLGWYGFNSKKYHTGYIKNPTDSSKKQFYFLTKNTITNPVDTAIHLRIFSNQINFIIRIPAKSEKELYLPEGTYNWISWVNNTQPMNQELNIDGYDHEKHIPLDEPELFYPSSKPWILKKNLNNTLILPNSALYNTGITSK
jgi:hypothetical protein